jgi:hypothetical protein
MWLAGEVGVMGWVDCVIRRVPSGAAGSAFGAASLQISRIK